MASQKENKKDFEDQQHARLLLLRLLSLVLVEVKTSPFFSRSQCHETVKSASPCFASPYSAPLNCRPFFILVITLYHTIMAHFKLKTFF